jgi:hypothetical protein
LGGHGRLRQQPHQRSAGIEIVVDDENYAVVAASLLFQSTLRNARKDRFIACRLWQPEVHLAHGPVLDSARVFAYSLSRVSLLA